MTVQIPGYKITKTLGKGGMATVYLALQDIFEREVALKVMSPALNEDPAFGQRFMREAQIVSKLLHPNIVTVYDVGLHQGCYFLSMEYIEGDDLKRFRKRLSFLEKIQTIRDIASALDVSGAKGYVHRDIKPENIMIEAATKRAVLMDFGIARASEADISVTQAGTAIGTPHYMSPEQAKGLDVDPRADLYSLGVVLFYLATGYIPFEGDSAVAIGIRHITEAVPELPPHLRDMQWLIDKAMAKDPRDRFQSGAELTDALNSIDLEQLEANISAQGDNLDRADFDTPTLVSEQPIHQYGDGTSDDEPEDFTLSFKTQEPPTLNLKWPMYTAGGCVALLAAIGIYLVATFEPSKIDQQSTQNKTPATQHSLSQLIIGNTVSPQQQKTIDTINTKINKAQLAYKKRQTESNLRALIGLYRELIAVNPYNETSLDTLNLLADEQITQIKPLFNQGDFKKAQRKLAQILSLFPDYTSPQLSHVRSEMTQRSKIESLKKDAIYYYNRKQFTQPAQQNATASYRAILVIAPEFEPAHAGIKRIASLLTQKAQGKLNSGDIKSAREFINQALQVLPNYEPALLLESQLLSAASIEEKTETLFKQSERYMDNGALYTPPGKNAYDALTGILALDKNNQLAEQRREQISERLQADAFTLIQKGHYEQALEITTKAQHQHPQNKQLESIINATEEAIQAHKYASTPRIVTIRASGVQNPDLDRKQPRTIAVNDKIFIRFEYQNFQHVQIAMQVRLINEQTNKALGTKPIFVKGPKGYSEFIFDLPRTGVKAGPYRVEIIVSNKMLQELSFKIG